jgi:RNA polymerase sigma factor (sigma-70 family)
MSEGRHATIDKSNPGKDRAGPDAAATAIKEAVMAAHEQALLRYATGILGNASAAQDVVQNAFIKLFRHWHPGLKPSRSIRPWLYRVTHNEAVDFIRRESRLRLLHLRQAQDPAFSDSLRAAGNPGEAQAEKMRLVLNCLDELTAREKQVLLLRLQEGLSYQEISLVTGRSTGNVGCLLHNAVKKIRIALARKDRAARLKAELAVRHEQATCKPTEPG